jgi:hypothetical protein
MNSAISAALAWVSDHQAILIPIGGLIVTDLINSSIKWSPFEISALGLLKQLLDRASIHTNSDSPGTLKLPFTRSAPPAIVGAPVQGSSGQVPIGKIGAIAIALLVAGSASAQTFSAGLSVPLLEIQPGNTHPVEFAPGAGAQANLGLFPETIAGEEADMLVFGAALFASAPGALQVAALVGTFNNIVCIGLAVPLYASDGSGVTQGSFHVYPVLGGQIPFDLGSAPEPSVAGAAGGKPRRFGTIYLNLL